MHPLSSAELLEAWERGSCEPVSSRAVALLTSACPEVSDETIAAWTIGERDLRLLKLREWTFGSHLFSIANCPGCGERLEWRVEASELGASRSQKPAPTEMLFESGRYCIKFRLPNVGDLGAIGECSDVAEARKALLGKCVMSARSDNADVDLDDMPAEVVEAIAKQMADADPQGDVQIDLSCPSCDHRWQALFDIESFFWSELNAWAQRILSEVHVLASAYGWREIDILNLSPQRRQIYLGLVSG